MEHMEMIYTQLITTVNAQGISTQVEILYYWISMQ